MIVGAGLVPALFIERINMESQWYLYILRCKDNTLYTGITTDVEKRLEAHRSGKGAKYTRGRAPLELVYRECCGSHSDALKREAEIKKLSRQSKELLLKTQESQRDSE
jgi:predicted GIY-YIG superfamily endonuclease